MGLFDFFKQPSPRELADRIFQHAVRVEITPEMNSHLTIASIDLEHFRKEQQLVQLHWAQHLLSHAAYSKKNKFFQDVSALFEGKLDLLVEDRQYFGFENKYRLNDHLREYYTFESDHKMVSMMFHALKKQTLVNKNEEARRVFTEKLRSFVDEMREIVLPHVKREFD